LGVTPSGTYAGSPVRLLISPPSAAASSITPANYQNLPAGVYQNTAAINIFVWWTVPGFGFLMASVPVNGVSGNIINTCKVTQSPGTLTFNIDPSISGTTNATISPDMQIKCTRNDNATITASSACGGATPRMASGYPPLCGASMIPYTFNFLSSITGQGFGGAGMSLGLGGSAASADYANAPVGIYGDQLMLTITH
jgi:hypothetical protein